MHAPTRQLLVAAVLASAALVSAAMQPATPGHAARLSVWQRTRASISAPSDYALRFNGTTDGSASYVAVADSANLELTHNFTLEGWVNWSGAGGYRSFLSKPRTDTPGQPVGTGYTLAIDNGQPCLALIVAQGPGTAVRDACGSQTVTPGVWTHIAATYTGLVSTVYVNGVVAASTTWPSSEYVVPGPTSLLFGREFAYGYGYLDRTFPGTLDEIRIWNVARSQDQIEDDMNLSLSGPQANLVGDWRFDEGSGTTTADASGFNQTGTLVNGPVWVPATWSATLSVMPTSGPAGSHTTVAGSNFRPLEAVQLKLYCASPTCNSHTVLGTATADASGAFTQTVTIPASASSGGHEIGAIGQTSGAFADRTFTVTP